MKLEELQQKFTCFGKQWMKTNDCRLCPNPSICKLVMDNSQSLSKNEMVKK